MAFAGALCQGQSRRHAAAGFCATLHMGVVFLDSGALAAHSAHGSTLARARPFAGRACPLGSRNPAAPAGVVACRSFSRHCSHSRLMMPRSAGEATESLCRLHRFLLIKSKFYHACMRIARSIAFRMPIYHLHSRTGGFRCAASVGCELAQHVGASFVAERVGHVVDT